jgi:signal peptidase II
LIINRIQNKAQFYATLLAVGIFLIDIISKQIAIFYGKPLFHLQYNPGVALSFLADQAWAPYFFLILNLAVALGIGVFLNYHHKRVSNLDSTAEPLNEGKAWVENLLPVGLSIVASGAFGNAVDRIIALFQGRPPYVTDFIYYPNLFTGNVADIAIVLGAILTGLYVILKV